MLTSARHAYPICHLAVKSKIGPRVQRTATALSTVQQQKYDAAGGFVSRELSDCPKFSSVGQLHIYFRSCRSVTRMNHQFLIAIAFVALFGFALPNAVTAQVVEDFDIRFQHQHRTYHNLL